MVHWVLNTYTSEVNTIKTTEQHYKIFLVPLLLTLDMFHTLVFKHISHVSDIFRKLTFPLF